MSLKRQLTATPLTSVTIPTMVMEQTSLGDAIAVLTQQIEKESKTKLRMQWVYQGIDKETWKHTVTLTAKKQSAGKLLSEILAQAKVEAKLEEHAIVLRPIAGAAAVPPAAAPAPAVAPAGGKEAPKRVSPLGPGATLDGKAVEIARKDDEWDRGPIKGRNPLKKK